MIVQRSDIGNAVTVTIYRVHDIQLFALRTKKQVVFPLNNQASWQLTKGAGI